MGDALNLLEETAGRVLPADYAVDYAGQSRQFQLSSSSLALTFVLALAFIYLVLAAQFESFRDPFIIMLTVPLSMTGRCWRYCSAAGRSTSIVRSAG